jgi:hypothetical protein
MQWAGEVRQWGGGLITIDRGTAGTPSEGAYSRAFICGVDMKAAKSQNRRITLRRARTLVAQSTFAWLGCPPAVCCPGPGRASASSSSSSNDGGELAKGAEGSELLPFVSDTERRCLRLCLVELALARARAATVLV